MANHDFTEACGAVVPFGKHKGQTLARVGNNDEGLKYLDWMRGLTDLREPFRTHLGTYLDHPAVALRVDQLIHD